MQCCRFFCSTWFLLFVLEQVSQVICWICNVYAMRLWLQVCVFLDSFWLLWWWIAFLQKGHGIRDSLLKDIRSISRQFFHLPYEEKLKIKLSAATGYRLQHVIIFQCLFLPLSSECIVIDMISYRRCHWMQRISTGWWEHNKRRAGHAWSYWCMLRFYTML